MNDPHTGNGGDGDCQEKDMSTANRHAVTRLLIVLAIGYLEGAKGRHASHLLAPGGADRQRLRLDCKTVSLSHTHQFNTFFSSLATSGLLVHSGPIAKSKSQADCFLKL